MFVNTETIGDLFDIAIALERTAEALYKQLEKLFSDYPEVAFFWKEYAGEEDGHAKYLERIKERMDTERLSRPADISMMQMAKICLKKASPAVLENINTLEDAYQLANELENSEVNAIFEFMIENFSTNELAQSQFLQAQLNSHIARLETDFPSPYKSRISRQNVFVSK